MHSSDVIKTDQRGEQYLNNIIKRLQISQEKFWQITRARPAIIYVVLPKQERFLYAIENNDEIIGYSIQESLDIKSYELFHPEYRQAIKDDSLNLLKDKGGIIQRDIKIISKDGGELWHNLVKTYIEFEGYSAILGVAYDINKRKIAEEIIVQQNKQLYLAEEKIRYLSFNDSLTGLYNRAFATTEIERMDSLCLFPLSIIVGDVNSLKLINDAFGYDAGDKLLNTIAAIIQQACRQGDIVARWSGDEFVVILPQTTHKEAYNICQHIQQLCREVPNNDPIQPSIALGASCKDMVDQDIYAVLAEAEASMYRNKLLERSSLRNSLISSLEQILNERTHETQEHACRMQVISIVFAQELGLARNEIDRLVLLAKLHDIGKIGVPDNILAKTKPLNPEEWEIIKQHPEIGSRITKTSHDLISIADEVMCHHERWDGTGYPGKLKGEEIPYLARIISIVDSYDVMTHGRPYKAAISSSEALLEIANCGGTQFDPKLAMCFFTVFDALYTEVS